MNCAKAIYACHANSLEKLVFAESIAGLRIAFQWALIRQRPTSKERVAIGALISVCSVADRRETFGQTIGCPQQYNSIILSSHLLEIPSEGCLMDVTVLTDDEKSIVRSTFAL